jgi:hypothetical protein|tara:strand:- start:26 stop:262 length:237 start_codon:yes stop_codon:yes gene_type:complete
MSYSENDDKLSRGINDFASHVEQYAKTSEDKLIMAAAMLSVVKAIYIDHALDGQIAETVFEKQLEDVFQINLVKPTLH